MKLGVFDSGIGGKAIADSLQITFPQATIVIVNDRQNIPYGNKSAKEIIKLTNKAIQPLLKSNCDIIILACNTATALAIETLRTLYPKQLFIGIEPMIKTAANLTKSHIITVCATPATLASYRYNRLVNKYGKDLEIIEPNCSDWARMIEFNDINHQNINATITDACDRGSDVIILGCTHYHWIKDEIITISAGRALVIEPSEAIGRRIKSLLKLG